MTDAHIKFLQNISECEEALECFAACGKKSALRYVWISAISALDLYMTELVSEAGLRLIDRSPRVMTTNLQQMEIPLSGVLELENMGPAERLIYFKERIFSVLQYKSFYRPEKISEALSYIWLCPGKEKWARILNEMKQKGRYASKTEQDVRDELALIGNRRDLIAHSSDTYPGRQIANCVEESDAKQVVEFIRDLVSAVDAETERQLS